MPGHLRVRHLLKLLAIIEVFLNELWIHLRVGGGLVVFHYLRVLLLQRLQLLEVYSVREGRLDVGCVVVLIEFPLKDLLRLLVNHLRVQPSVFPLLTPRLVFHSLDLDEFLEDDTTVFPCDVMQLILDVQTGQEVLLLVREFRLWVQVS